MDLGSIRSDVPRNGVDQRTGKRRSLYCWLLLRAGIIGAGMIIGLYLTPLVVYGVVETMRRPGLDPFPIHTVPLMLRNGSLFLVAGTLLGGLMGWLIARRIPRLPTISMGTKRQRVCSILGIAFCILSIVVGYLPQSNEPLNLPGNWGNYIFFAMLIAVVLVFPLVIMKGVRGFKSLRAGEDLSSHEPRDGQPDDSR